MNHVDAGPAAGTRPARATMAAVVQDRYGPDPRQVLRVAEAPRPEPGPGEVLVRVHAAGVDAGTWHLMAGMPLAVRVAGFGLRRPTLLNPGRAVSGVVEAVGPGVLDLSPGDAVHGPATAGFAGFAVARADRLAPRPATLSHVQAAAVPVSGVTALQAVRDHGRVRAGQQVLVIGASGGVGSFAVQLAAAAGARVTGMAGPDKLDLVRSLGAEHVLDRSRDDVTAGGRRYDVILDIAGNRRIAHLRRALAPHGRLVITGGMTSGRWLGGIQRQLWARLLAPFTGQRLFGFVARENAADLRELGELIDAGRVVVPVDRVFGLAAAADAVRYLAEGRVRGKVVIAVRPGGRDDAT